MALGCHSYLYEVFVTRGLMLSGSDRRSATAVIVMKHIHYAL